MIWLLEPDQPKATEFAPAMDEGMGILPGLPSVMGKPVHVAFDLLHRPDELARRIRLAGLA
jgi:hypothetical protein